MGASLGRRVEGEARLAALEERSKRLSTRTFVLASHVPTYALIIGLYFR